MKTRKCILLMACIIATMILTGCGKTKININDYFKYEVVGANGYGTLKFERDEDRIVNDIALAKKLSEEQAFALYLPIEDVLFHNGSWDKENMLSNGDVIKFKFSLDDSVNKKIDGIEFTWSDIEYKVEGLSEAIEFDPFDKLEIKFVGISGEAEIKIDGEQYGGITYIADKKKGIKNGETVTITAEINDMDAFVNQYGMIPLTTTKQYTAEGLDSYVLNDEITQNDNLEIIKSTAVDRINEYFTHFAYFDFKDEGFIESPSVFWKLTADITDDIELVDLLYGNGKGDESKNFISVFLKVPYIVNAETNSETKELGSGDAYFSVTIKNNVLTDQGLVIGTVKDLTVKRSEEELITSLNSYKTEYELSEIIKY